MSHISEAERSILLNAGWQKSKIAFLEHHYELRATLPVYTLDVAEAFADGSLDVLSCVAAMLNRIDPANGDLPTIYAALYRLRQACARQTHGPGKGRKAHWAIPLKDIPDETLQSIRCQKCSEEIQRRMLSTLREIYGAARRAGLTENFDRQTLAAFRDELDGREWRPASIETAMIDSYRLGQLFAADGQLLDLIRVEIDAARRERRSSRSKMEAAFRAAPLSPIDYARKARQISELAYSSTAGRQTRHKLFITAAVLAFLSWLPERISDILKLVIDRDAVRTKDGWRSDYFSNKIDEDRSLALLPEDLTPYLDDLLLLGADPGFGGEVFDRLYRQRAAMRSPLFARVGLDNAYSRVRIFELVKAETGHGPHAARKAMADYVAEIDAPIEDILAHLGHRSLVTSQEFYEVHAAKIRRKHTQDRLNEVRRELTSAESTFRTPDGRLVDLGKINRAIVRLT